MADAQASDLRLAELIAALSLATDLGMGQPPEFALRSCVLAIRLGDALHLGTPDLHDVYYQALLRYIGCNAETFSLAALFGDELALRTEFVTIDQGRSSEVIGFALRRLRRANAGAPLLRLVRNVARGLVMAPGVVQEGYAGHCEVAQRLAARLHFGDTIIRALGQLYERWDGRGAPNGLKGENVALAVRVVALAQDAIVFQRIGGVEAAVAVARARKGTAYDPRIATCFCEQAPRLLAGLEDEPSWEAVLAMEPGPRTYLPAARFDTACQAIADFADLKSPYTLGHSRGVATLAAAAARQCGLPEADVTTIWRAALVQDVGRVGVSSAIWGKAGPLSDREWERVRLHPYFTERVLARPIALARLGSLASQHHERLDGSGYHRGAVMASLSPMARILAAADTYQALTETRPHRPARSAEDAAGEARREARRGRLDADAVGGVLAAAGHRVGRGRRELVAGLSEREIEVLRLVARGHSMKEIAGVLVIAGKTVDNHLQHIYGKIGVSTRAGATLFAVEHDLLAEAGSFRRDSAQ